MKSEIGSFIATHRGIWRASVALYRRVIASDFVRKVVETFATRILLIGIGLVTSVIVARILGPKGRGLYAVAATIGAIGIQFANFGLHSSNTYFVAKNRELLPSLIGNSLIVSFVFGGLSGIIIWLIFNLWPSVAPVKGFLLGLSLLWIPFGLAYMFMQSLLLGIYEVRSYNMIDAINNIFTLFLISGLIIIGTVSVESVFSIGLIALISAFIWIFLELKKHLNGPLSFSISLFKKNFLYGFKAYIACLFAFLVLRLDLLMINHMLEAENAGYYSLAAQMSDMLYMFIAIVNTILFPKLSAMRSNIEKWKYAKFITGWMAIIMGFLVILSALLAKTAIVILYGKTFLPSAPAFIWLLPGIFMKSVNAVLMYYFASIGMPPITVYSPGFAMVLNILLNLKFIPSLGIIGASIASTISYSFMLVVSIFYIFFIQKRRMYEQTFF